MWGGRHRAEGLRLLQGGGVCTGRAARAPGCWAPTERGALARGEDGSNGEEVVMRSREQGAVSRVGDPPYLRHTVVKAASAL